MEEYFSNITIDKIIGLSSFIITIFSLIYAYRESKKSKVDKKIKLNYSSTFSIFKENSSLETEELKLMWNEKEVGNIFLIEIYLKNYGNTSLVDKDFLKPIIISFNENTELLKTKIFSNSEFTKLKWKPTRNEIQIDVELFEKAKMIKTEIIYTNNKVSPANIDIAILDGNKEIEKIEGNLIRENLDREMDAKLHSISLWGGLFIMYFLGSLIIPFIINLFIKFFEIQTSDVTKGLIFAPFLVLGFYKMISEYSKDMEFAYLNNNWVEFKPE